MLHFFSEAHNFAVSNSQFVHQSHNITIGASESDGAGLQKLLEASIPEAFHDSAARYPYPLCHPGTRRGHLGEIVQWCHNADHRLSPVALFKGPAGVGKSAIAQSLAEQLKERLGAALFLSRTRQRDDHGRLFPSIAYQLAVKFQPYGHLLNRKVHHDPTLVNKSISHQFNDLLSTPIHELKLKGAEFPQRVIIIDGLDECPSALAKEDIVKTIATSVREQTTPFLWIFFTRNDPNITAIFDLPEVKTLCHKIELPISREVDNDIALYLTDTLTKIGQKHQFQAPWPSKQEIQALVDLSAGLFVCAATIIRFIAKEDSAGPDDQLRAVLDLVGRSANVGPDHPLSGMNEFYTLIMERIPPANLRTVQWILLIARLLDTRDAVDYANLLGLSEVQFRNACRSLHPVMIIDAGRNISFYHASFLDFLEDPSRSNHFCIWGACMGPLWDKLLDRLDQVQVNYDPGEGYIPELNNSWQSSRNRYLYVNLIRVLFRLLESVHLDDTQRLNTLASFDFRKLCLLPGQCIPGMRVEKLLRNISLQANLLRRATRKNSAAAVRGVLCKSDQHHYYTLGRGEKRALLKEDEDGNLCIVPYSKKGIQKFMKRLYEGHRND